MTSWKRTVRTSVLSLSTQQALGEAATGHKQGDAGPASNSMRRSLGMVAASSAAFQVIPTGLKAESTGDLPVEGLNASKDGSNNGSNDAQNERRRGGTFGGLASRVGVDDRFSGGPIAGPARER